MFPEPQVVTDAEVLAQRKTRDDYAAKLSDVQAQIQRCREQLKELETIESRLAYPLWIFSRALAPVTRVPDDILREIFLHCLPNRREIQFNPHEALVLLTRVCRRWKDLAMGFSSLWRALKVEPRMTAKSRDFGLQLSTEWLKRAQQAPIGLQFVVPPYFRGSVGGALPRLIQPNASSTFVTVLSLVRIPLQEIFAVGPGLLPALQRLTLSLEIHDSGTMCPCRDHGPIQTFKDCRALVSVALKSSFCGSSAHPHISLPLARLAHFIEYGRPYSTSFTKQLPTLQRLRLLSLTLQIEDLWPRTHPNPQDDHTGMVAMKNLKTLRIQTSPYVPQLTYPDFFSRFEFPNLETLMLSLSTSSMEFPVLASVQEELFFRKLRSFQFLTTLSLKASRIYDDPLRKILRATPLITTLDIELQDNDCHYDSILDLLTPDPRTATYEYLIPFLHTFSVHIRRDHWDRGTGRQREPIGSFTLSNFIESRLARSGHNDDVSEQASRNLRRVVIFAYLEKYLSPQRGFIRTIQWYVPRGLQLELRVKREHEWTMMVPEVSGWVEEADVH